MSCSFQKSWLTRPDFIGWLSDVSDDKHSAYCTACCRTITLSNMGLAALISHASGKKHQKNMSAKLALTKIDTFFKQKDTSQLSATSTNSSPSPVPASHSEKCATVTFDIQGPAEDSPGVCAAPANQPEFHVPPPPPVDVVDQPAPAPRPIRQYMQSSESRKAEIIWTLKCVVDHYSFKSNENISDIFRAMFWDSNIAQGYNLSRTKMAYLVTFGIAPLFREALIDRLKSCDGYVVLVDEAFNKHLQLDQMDCMVQYWHEDKVITRYLGSTFMGRTKADDLLAGLKSVLAPLDTTKMLQLGMDGPNVNLKLAQLLTEDRKKEDAHMPDLIDIGSCSLHVVHGAFQTGVKKTGWDLEKFLHSLWWLFHDSYKRRTEYTSITGSSDFPRKFCSTRWVEDQAVAQRALEILPHMVKYINETLKKKKSEIPSVSSFHYIKDIVVKVETNLIRAKLEFFYFIAGLLKPFLLRYQEDRPLIIFLADDLVSLLVSLMELYVKPDILNANRAPHKLVNLDTSNKDNQLPPKKVGVGNGARLVLSSVNNGLSDLARLKFQSECISMLCGIVGKVQERCPLKFSVLRSLCALNPTRLKEEDMSSHFCKLTSKLVSGKTLSKEVGDLAERQFRQMVREERDALNNFDPKKDRVDTYYHDLLSQKESYKDLWSVVRMVMVLSHGQASIERGFSVNEDFLTPRTKKETLTALRLVYDTVKVLNIKVSGFQVSDKMLRYAKQAKTRYEQHLTEEKESKKQDSLKRKAAECQAEYSSAKKRLKDLESQATSCIEEADKKSKDALKKKDFNLLAQAIALRDKGSEIMNTEVEKQKKVVNELHLKMVQK